MSEMIRLVIVDDHDLMRETWKMVLQSDPRMKVVAECSSGKEAIECVEFLPVDVMLMDINMSPVNGFEATRKIAKAYPSIKIIGLSINNQPSYARNMIQLGARGYMTKNSTKEEMIKAIVAVMNGEVYICQDIRDRMQPDE
jgi:two-component system invasion response regulator UvrY